MGLQLECAIQVKQLIPFRQRLKAPQLPNGFILKRDESVSAALINRLLARCNERTHSPKRLIIALEKSFCYLSIFEERSGKLVAFVRATSDKGLNANIWNLVAEPGKNQEKLIDVLIHNMLSILKRELPGCSISVCAPSMSLQALKDNGFLLDPNGIRVMGFRLR